MLRKCVGDPTRIVPINDVQVTEKLAYDEIPIAILDRQVRRLRNKEVASVKVLWRNNNREEMTWEAEDSMRSKYPHLFQPLEEGQDEASGSQGTYTFFLSFWVVCGQFVMLLCCSPVWHRYFGRL